MENNNNLRTIMESTENFSLRKLAVATGANYNMLLKYSKQPIVGTVYDPTAFNYEAVEQYLAKKCPDLDYNALAKMDFSNVNATKVPFTLSLGMQLKLRQDEAVYEVVYFTDTHVVIKATDSTQPRVFSNPTFMHQGPKPLATEAVKA